MSSLSNLIKFVQQKYPGLSKKDAYYAIIEVKETDGGHLKGLNKVSFMKLFYKFMRNDNSLCTFWPSLNCKAEKKRKLSGSVLSEGYVTQTG